MLRTFVKWLFKAKEKNMINIETVRLWTSKEHGTFSALKINKELFSWTLEPYECIPAGQYTCKRVKSELVRRLTHGLLDDTFEVMNVPGRTLIRFHPGNTDKDTLGCFLPGETLGKLQGNRAVLNSGATFKQFMALLDEYDGFILTIKEGY